MIVSMLVVLYYLFFFFMQMTAYEMRISDWSSDVCSSDLLGMELRQAEAIRDLERGRFLALGPAIARRPVAVKIGPVETAARSGGHALLPLPPGEPQDMESLLFAPSANEPPPPPEPKPVTITADDLILTTRSEERREGKEGVSTVR